VKKTLIAILLALALVVIPVGSALAAPSAGVTITATPATYVSISNDTPSWAVGTVDKSTDYWWKGSAPTWPLGDGGCTATISNDGNVTENIAIKGANFTSGGVGWTLVTGTPGQNEVRLTAWKSLDAEVDGKNLTTSDQTFISSLAATGTKKWEMRMTTGTFTDNAAKSGAVTLTASAS
jgi:hypothetical protein